MTVEEFGRNEVQVDDPDGDWTAPGTYEVADGVYRIPLPLPQDGLRAVNVYAVRDGDGLVLVDSGWAIALARDLLEQSLKALDCGFADVRRFLVTHVHRDHYTLAVTLRREFGMRVSIGRDEAATLRTGRDPEHEPWGGLLLQLHRGGGDALGRELVATIPSNHDVRDWEDPDDWLDAPGPVSLESGTWEMHPTPGHTRGHVVFVDPARDVMFAGDHVLPRITPSIGFEQAPSALPLGDYLRSLRLVRELPDRRLLAAHGPAGPSVHARVDELVEHHDTRLSQARAAVAAGAGTAAEAARRLRWTRREHPYDDLDLFSRCLAVTETMAHLDVLAAGGTLVRTDEDGVHHYVTG
ncbi:MAG: MBL fold metallo-hydrolase [Pseudonocardia sp.]|uniref:MBL fold metallo-hydrolase n=1 Tax=Pseudonocardia sp. TaxID=60912 RepID=UPI001ACBA863|nr:MBL fold metallo-hydrolase [Pseudonocardia sp.]MBN9097510.1 MBL fold metallo-hydrolase [Pseudonocardia sp.]